jgi:aspartate-semialdehyde dehydrogenase
MVHREPEPRIAVVGATGAVGTVMLECLHERGLWNEIVRLFATERSAGRCSTAHVVEALDDEADLSGFDIALFSAGGGTSRSGRRGSSRRARP